MALGGIDEILEAASQQNLDGTQFKLRHGYVLRKID
jgi:hypothetical protein